MRRAIYYLFVAITFPVYCSASLIGSGATKLIDVLDKSTSELDGWSEYLSDKLIRDLRIRLRTAHSRLHTPKTTVVLQTRKVITPDLCDEDI